MGWVLVLFSLEKDNLFSKIYLFLMARIEPIFMYCRRFLPPIAGLDFSPMIIFILIDGLRRLIRMLFLYLLGGYY